MNYLLHRSPSVGSLVKKIMTVNPELSSLEIISLIRQATQTQGDAAGEYALAEVVDEKRALELAKATLLATKSNPTTSSSTQARALSS